MRISESEYKMVVQERNRLKGENARLVNAIRNSSQCTECVHEVQPNPYCCKHQPCKFQLKPKVRKRP